MTLCDVRQQIGLTILSSVDMCFSPLSTRNTSLFSLLLILFLFTSSFPCLPSHASHPPACQPRDRGSSCREPGIRCLTGLFLKVNKMQSLQGDWFCVTRFISFFHDCSTTKPHARQGCDGDMQWRGRAGGG